MTKHPITPNQRFTNCHQLIQPDSRWSMQPTGGEVGVTGIQYNISFQ